MATHSVSDCWVPPCQGPSNSGGPAIQRSNPDNRAHFHLAAAGGPDSQAAWHLEKAGKRSRQKLPERQALRSAGPRRRPRAELENRPGRRPAAGRVRKRGRLH